MTNASSVGTPRPDKSAVSISNPGGAERRRLLAQRTGARSCGPWGRQPAASWMAAPHGLRISISSAQPASPRTFRRSPRTARRSPARRLLLGRPRRSAHPRRRDPARPAPLPPDRVGRPTRRGYARSSGGGGPSRVRSPTRSPWRRTRRRSKRPCARRPGFASASARRHMSPTGSPGRPRPRSPAKSGLPSGRSGSTADASRSVARPHRPARGRGSAQVAPPHRGRGGADGRRCDLAPADPTEGTTASGLKTANAAATTSPGTCPITEPRPAR